MKAIIKPELGKEEMYTDQIDNGYTCFAYKPTAGNQIHIIRVVSGNDGGDVYAPVCINDHNFEIDDCFKKHSVKEVVEALIKCGFIVEAFYHSVGSTHELYVKNFMINFYKGDFA